MCGYGKPVEKLKTVTGMKDKITQHWIEMLLERARQLKTSQPGILTDEIATELAKWFKEQLGDKINPLLLFESNVPQLFAIEAEIQLLLLGLDPTQDTPVEILHTILLGIVKYLWHNLHTSWSEAQQNLFDIHLQSSNIDRLTVPPI
jgi:hypothetical protein